MSRVLLFACVVMLALPLAAQQQDSSAPPPQQHSQEKHKKPDQQNQTQKKPAEQNPFPEAQSEAAARQAQQQEQPAPPSAPAPRETTPDKPSEAGRNPFPEQQSRQAAQPDQKQSSSGSSSSSSQAGLEGFEPPKTADDLRNIHNPSLGKKDTQVGLFYLKTGDFRGAYDRLQEAARVDPTNADAVFGLAEAARHLNRRDEAIRNYQLYLSALPDGPRAKDARKGLKELGVKPNS
ncbi:MAG TPA: tetratricopeptide repeat protein [Acidobacteriaceae bacterium]|nr:tetratricopeptide repeat protein [Acidobacteriaceae bacterium]